jgi:hypothetical protein
LKIIWKISKILLFGLKLALKVFNISDIPTQLLDVKVQDYSWTPKGIIVHGSNSEVIDKRVKLELIYSEKE